MVKKLFIPLLIIAASCGFLVVMYMNQPEPDQTDAAPITIVVEVMPVVSENAAVTIQSQGTVEPRTSTNLVTEVAGQVIEVSSAFVAGGFFRTGDILLKIDDQNYRAAVSRAESTVASARSQLEQERGQADVAQREWDRMTPAQQSQVRAKELYLRKPQLQEAIARLESAEADLSQAQSDLNKTHIVAPYDGLISQKSTDIGQFVSTGSTLAEIFAVDYAEVRLPIPENKIQYLDLPNAMTGTRNTGSMTLMGPEVELVSTLGGSQHSWTGHLSRTEGVLDTRTRVLFSVIQVEDPYNIYGDTNKEPLRIGTYVNAAIEGKTLHDVVVLPRHTVQGGNTVWVTDQENRLRSRVVTVVTTNGDYAYISEGLESGDKVVVTRVENPLNGTLVQIKELPGTGIQ